MSLWLLIFSVNVVGAVLPPWACDRILKESYGAFGWLEEQKVRALCEYVVIHKLLIAKDSSSAQPLCEEFQNRVEPLWNPKIWDPRKEKTSNQQLSPQNYDGDITELEAAQALACHGVRRLPDTHLVYNPQHDQSVARHEIPVEFNANTRGTSTPNTGYSSASTSPQVNEKNNVLGTSSTVVSPKTPLLPLLTSSAGTATSSTAKPVVGDNTHTNNNNNGHDTNSKSINSFAFNATTHLTDNGHDTTSVMLPGAPIPGNNNTNNTPVVLSSTSSTVSPVPPQSQTAYEGGLWSDLMERLGKRIHIISARVLNFICDEECLKTNVGTPTLHIRR